ncbi:hypothetical protein BJ508DRAFT_330140 [Ascobolus immersus RN42]|uniref:Uncharacterized protein n=1 Tax=Ascobolus immersus RN42 TaxID=1160509 RepID=A0A3N4HYE5_ASCIM|nr:hypothetical protein BJ508DRAFT_330140 [Ascobolus immersus RN42]
MDPEKCQNPHCKQEISGSVTRRICSICRNARQGVLSGYGCSACPPGSHCTRQVNRAFHLFAGVAELEPQSTCAHCGLPLGESPSPCFKADCGKKRCQSCADQSRYATQHDCFSDDGSGHNFFAGAGPGEQPEGPGQLFNFVEYSDAPHIGQNSFNHAQEVSNARRIGYNVLEDDRSSFFDRIGRAPNDEDSDRESIGSGQTQVSRWSN